MNIRISIYVIKQHANQVRRGTMGPGTLIPGPITAIRSGFCQAPQYVVQNAAILEIGELVRGIDTDTRFEARVTALGMLRHHLDRLLPGADRPDTEVLIALETEAVTTVVGGKLQRQYAHTNQVGAVNALVTARDHCTHAQQGRAFRGPVAGGAGTVLLAREHHERNVLVSVALRRIED